MRVVEVRRQSLVRDHVHLSQAGIELAQRVGSKLGSFHRVVTSHITRTLETAVAMGFAVDEQWPVLGEIAPDVWADGCMADLPVIEVRGYKWPRRPIGIAHA